MVARLEEGNVGEGDAASRVHEILAQQRKKTRGSRMLLDGAMRLSYSELLDRSERLATYVRQQGLGVGDRAVIITDDDAATIEIFFGLIAAGVTAVVLNPHGSEDEIVALVKAADAAIAFVDEGRCAGIDIRGLLCGDRTVLRVLPAVSSSRRLFARLTGRGRVTNGRDGLAYPDLLANFPPSLAPPPPVPESTTAYILFTSGTTSRPKGVEITHRNLFSQMDTFVKQYGLDADTRIMNLLPLYHTDGLTHGAVVSLVCGGTLVRPMRFRVDRLPALLDEVYKSRVTHFITVPSMLSLIRQLGTEYQDCFDTEEFRFVISTAAYLDPNLWADLQESHNIRIVNVYGLTETVCEACYCGPDDESFRIGTVGKPVDCEVRVVDPNGKALPAGEAGELLIKGDNVMKGYFRMPEETAEVLKGGWFHTGDIACVDDEGFVSIVGRKKSVIISGGYNVYPEDVTNVLMQMDGIVDAVTLGMPDPTWGEIVVSCIIVDPEKPVTPAEVSEFFLHHAAREKLPRAIHVMEDFPRGPAGKVQLKELRSMLESTAGPGTAGEPEPGRSLYDTVRDIAANVFRQPADGLSEEASPETIATWNSLAHVEFLMALEVEFGQKFSPRDIMSISNLGQAVRVLQRKVG